MNKTPKWRLKMSLNDKTVNALIHYGRTCCISIEGPLTPTPVPNPNFIAPNPVPSPTLVAVRAALDELERLNNLPLYDTKTVDVQNQREVVENLLTSLGWYVQGVANLPAKVAVGDSVIISAGMEVAKKGGSFKPEDLMVNYQGKNFNRVNARDKRFGQGTIYIWQIRVAGNSQWISVMETTAAKYTFVDLALNVNYEFRTKRNTKGVFTYSTIQALPG